MTSTADMTQQGPSRVDSWKMFDRIAGSYDRLNRILSLRRDVAWRRRVARFLPDHPDLKVLDLATGTGDQLFALFDAGASLGKAVGMDLSENMLKLGREKIRERGMESEMSLETGDTLNIPASDASFDVATISFGIRNVTDVPAGLREILRVLRPGGRLIVLECSMPRGPVLRSLYVSYFRNILPWIGGLVSGDAQAYRYLNRTVETFPCGEDFCDLMKLAGYESVSFHPQTLGVATLYVGDVPLKEVGGGDVD